MVNKLFSNTPSARRPVPRKPFAHSQRGLSTLGWLSVVVLVIFIGSLTLRIGPHYIDFRVVSSIMERLPDTTHKTMSRDDIREHFSKRFRIENFPMAVKDVIKIERSDAATIVKVGYEIREPLIYNADVVLSFSDQRIFE